MSQLLSWDEARHWREEQRRHGKRVVFTNGCFDILHAGHVELLEQARAKGDALVLGLNSDASVQRLKGPNRPVVPEQDRARVLIGLRAIDAVVLFNQDTPLELITELVPDVLVKGGDWKPEDVVGKEVVEAGGGEVVIIPLVAGRSTTNVIAEVVKRYGSDSSGD